VLLIPVFGRGVRPGIGGAVFVQLVAVVLNTLTGIRAVNTVHLENCSAAFGLNRRQVLLTRVGCCRWRARLLAGIKDRDKSSASDTATLEALGAGAGPVWSANRLRTLLERCSHILTGAIPAA